MIPLQALRTDIFHAVCVIVLSGSALVWSEHDIPVAPLTLMPTPIVHTQPANVIIPTLIPYTEIATSRDEATTSHEVRNPVVTKSASHTTKNPPAKTATKPITSAVQTTETDAQYITTLVRLINEQSNTFRKSHGLSLFTTDAELVHNATAYSKTMLAGNFLSHSDKKGCDMTCRFTRDGYNAWAWAENLAVLNFGDRPTPEYVANYFMTAWEKSADHRANLLNPVYTEDGIGVAVNGTRIYVTVQFAEPK